MSNRKALCVGINEFQNHPGNALRGCVNDARQMAGVLEKYLGFSSADITLLTDAQATRAAIMAQLADMVNGARSGKYAYLVFSFSSHGTQVADRNGDEPDRYDEAFCPTDLAEKNGQWDPNHIIVDDELHELFAQVPDNVLVEVYLDTCHSGTGLKAMDLMPDRQPRYIAPPSMAACNEVLPLMARGLRRRVTEKAAKNVVLWAACRDNQTSADARIDGTYHGAFTYYWVRELAAANNKVSRSELLKKVNADLGANHYTQVAQLECPARQRGTTLG
ncbi:MAG: caspase family protein [Chlorobiaceae bacterium]|nr:caspase family protein [Chlorobiaceae bacterium]